MPADFKAKKSQFCVPLKGLYDEKIEYPGLGRTNCKI
jgi:hypothetical protein